MTGVPVYIAGMGVVSALGNGVDSTLAALRAAARPLAPVALFAVRSDRRLPVGAVDLEADSDPPPRTHRLARLAAEQALAGAARAPDAIVVGSTTGGILTTELLFE